MSQDDDPGTTTSPLVRLRAVSKVYPGVVALDAVDFDLQPGEVHCLVGENGAGKSTLVKILAGVHQPTSGEIEVAGEAVSIPNPHEAQRLGFAFIFQELHVVNGLSVAANIVIGHEPRKGWLINVAAARREAREVLSSIGFAGLDPGRTVASLSTAERQAVVIARALRLQARVIVMDEPTTALSNEEVEGLFSVIRELKAQGRTVVFISHRLDEIKTIGDRVTVLKDGRHVVTKPVANTNGGELIRAMVGRSIGAVFPPKDRTTGATILELWGVASADIADISLSVRAGEVLCLAGLMGAGRTALLRCLFGLSAITDGRLEVDGQPVVLRSPRDAIQAGLALVPEDRLRQGIIAKRSVRENLSVLWTLTRRRLRGDRQEVKLARDLIQKLRIKTPSPEEAISQLSGGNQQKVVVGKWLAVRPRVLLLDEPTAGVDIGAKAELFGIIDGLARSGMAVVMASSELTEVLGMADRILVMREGRLAGELGPHATEEDVVALATGHEAQL